MPDIDLDDIPLDSSVSENTDVAHEQPAEKVEAQAETQRAESEKSEDRAKSSDAQPKGENDKTDLLKVVRDVTTESRKGQAAAPPAEKPEGSEDDPKGAKKQPDDENFTDVPFHQHPRMRTLIAQRNSFRDDAQRYQNVQGFLDQQGLNGQEAADGLALMGLAKTNPAECLKQLRPWLEKVVMAAGEMLPTDLQAEVDKGTLTNDIALRIARERAARETSERQHTAAMQRFEGQRVQEHAAGLRSAAEGWEADRARKDPNFAAKQQALVEKVHWLQRTEGVPNTREGVVAQCEKAYKAVNAALPQPVRQNGARPVTPIRGGLGSGPTRAEPKNMLERVQMVRDGMRAASA